MSERLGHASAVAFTLSVYVHVLPSQQEGAASRFAGLLAAAGEGTPAALQAVEGS